MVVGKCVVVLVLRKQESSSEGPRGSAGRGVDVDRENTRRDANDREVGERVLVLRSADGQEEGGDRKRKRDESDEDEDGRAGKRQREGSLHDGAGMELTLSVR